MRLFDLIKETEKLGIHIILTDLPNSKGRHEEYKGYKLIFLDKKLEEVEAVNVLLHERSHFINEDFLNSLSHCETYSHRIETVAEKDRIIDFMNLVNQEYPIDETFNYLDYMEKAFIPAKYENFVKEIAESLFNKNKKD